MVAVGRIQATRQMQLQDGRRLAFQEYGDPQGVPLFFLHGMPGTRFWRHPDEALTQAAGIRLITVDRPGIGLSSPQPGRTLRGFVQDLARLADALRIDRFAVLGYSAGGPYAMACAHDMPDRLIQTLVVSGVGPVDELHELALLITPSLSRIARLRERFPWGLGMVFNVLWNWEGARDPDKFMQSVIDRMPPEDRCVFDPPEMRRMIVENWEVLRESGPGAYWQDMQVILGHWGFEPADIRVPVQLWWGELDAVTPIAIAQALQVVMPQARLHSVVGEGHFLILSNWLRILSAVHQDEALP